MTHYDIAIPQGPPMDEGTTFALPPATRFRPLLPLLFIGALPGLLGLLVVAATLQRGTSTPARVIGITTAALVIVFAVGFLLASLRSVWKPVTVGPAGVTIRNVFQTRTVQMDEVAGFDVGYYGLTLRLTVGPVRNPRSIMITGLNTVDLSGSRVSSAQRQARKAPVIAFADEMNAELDRLRGTNPSTAERLKAAKPAPRAVGWADDEEPLGL